MDNIMILGGDILRCDICGNPITWQESVGLTSDNKAVHLKCKETLPLKQQIEERQLLQAKLNIAINGLSEIVSQMEQNPYAANIALNTLDEIMNYTARFYAEKALDEAITKDVMEIVADFFPDRREIK